MPTHWHPSSCFGRYSSWKRTKWIHPSNERLLIWHKGHKWYGIILIFSHMRVCCPVSGTGPIVGNLKRTKQLRELTEVKHMEYFPFYMVSLSGRLQGWHTEKPRLKSLSPWNQRDFCHWLPGNQDFFLRYFEKDCSQSCSAVLTSVSSLAAADLHQLRIWSSVLQRDRFILLSVCIVTHQPEPVLRIKRGL